MNLIHPDKLKQYSYFSNLSYGSLDEISKRLHVVAFAAGTRIIEEGVFANSFYFIKSGEVEVSKKTRWGQEAKIRNLRCGEGFGEMALLTCSPRFCSVIARTDVTLYKLYRNDFEDIVQTESVFSNVLSQKIKDYSQYNDIKTLQPFALLEPEKMLALTEKLIEKKYAPGEKIIVQGEKGDAYYIVKSGRVAVLKKKGEKDPVQIASLSDGEAFGEEAIIREEPRNATVQATDMTTVLRLDKSDFDEILKKSFLEWDFPEDVEEYKDQYFIIDVRTEPEYEEEHIEGAVNMPIEILRKKCLEINRSLTYLTYCTNESRGKTAAFLMKSHGLKARALRGGLNAWNGPLVRGKDGIHIPQSTC